MKRAIVRCADGATSFCFVQIPRHMFCFLCTCYLADLWFLISNIGSGLERRRCNQYEALSCVRYANPYSGTCVYRCLLTRTLHIHSMRAFMLWSSFEFLCPYCVNINRGRGETPTKRFNPKNRIIAERYQEVKVIIVDSICLLPFHV